MNEIASRAPAFTGAAARVQSLMRALQRNGVPTHLLETSRSWVLLAGPSAYKLWKPPPGNDAAPGWLARNRHLCEEEVRLNRRLAGAAVQDVLPIRGTPEAPSLNGSGPVVDYAVAMPRVGPSALASLRLIHGALEAVHMSRLAEFIDHFHREAALAKTGMVMGGAGQMAASARAVLTELGELGAMGEVAPPAVRDALERWLQVQLSALGERFSSRLACGHVRECHGDLRLEHVLVRGDEARVFSGVEHDPARRWIDVQSDIAGVVVDLLAHGRRDLAFVFLNRYLDCSGDYAGLDVLRFYLVHRALLRALDPAPGANAPDGNGGVGTREYLALAMRLMNGRDARLLITHGPAGAGKSFAAGLLLERAGAIRVSEDVERQRLHGHAPWAHLVSDDRRAAQRADLGAGWHGHDRRATQEGNPTTLLVHDRLRLAAGRALAAGFPTIVDAECLHRWQRDGLRDVAAALGAPFTILDCRREEAAALAELIEDGDALGELEHRWMLTLGHCEPLSPATLAAHWLAASNAPPVPPAPRH